MPRVPPARVKIYRCEPPFAMSRFATCRCAPVSQASRNSLHSARKQHATRYSFLAKPDVSRSGAYEFNGRRAGVRTQCHASVDSIKSIASQQEDWRAWKRHHSTWQIVDLV